MLSSPAAPADHAHGLLTFIEHHKIRVLRFASRQRQKMAGIQIPKHPDAILRCACQWVVVVRLDRTRKFFFPCQDAWAVQKEV